MGQDARGEHDGGPGPVPPRADPPGHETEEQKSQRDAQRVGVLTGQGREEIPAVNGVRVVEQVAQGEGGHGSGERPAHAEEPTHGPRGHREQHRSEHGDPLEGHGVRDDIAAQGGQQVGQDEVIGIERKAVVPARIPAGQLAVPQEVGPQEGRHGVVAAVVTTGGRRGGDEQARVHPPEHDGDHRGDAHEGGHRRDPPRGRERLRPAMAGRAVGGRGHLFGALTPDRARQWTPPRWLRIARMATRLKDACATMFMPRRPVR